MSDTTNNNRVFDENVVMFPASKNFPPAESLKEELSDDPLEDLLNEFSEVIDYDLDNDLESELEEIARERMESQFRNQSLRNLAQLDQAELSETVTQQMKLLSETQMRLNYLLKEIESYMPGRK